MSRQSDLDVIRRYNEAIALDYVIGTAQDQPNPLFTMFQNGNVISHEEAHERDRIRGIKGPPIMEFPVSYPIVDANGNFLCMSDDHYNLPPEEPEADTPHIVGG